MVGCIGDFAAGAGGARHRNININQYSSAKKKKNARV